MVEDNFLFLSQSHYFMKVYLQQFLTKSLFCDTYYFMVSNIQYCLIPNQEIFMNIGLNFCSSISSYSITQKVLYDTPCFTKLFFNGVLLKKNLSWIDIGSLIPLVYMCVHMCLFVNI
uniref:Uncharacterized protein n=1 Tax=Octopus bimaculoides TaxID=37653 RepID=A0A0L8G326_OCTBM